MKNPVLVLPGANDAIQALIKVTQSAGVPGETLELVHMRGSQINGCALCVAFGLRSAKGSGISAERLGLVSVWREASCYTDAERAALALTEHMTRMADRTADVVPEELWNELTGHYDEQRLSALIVWIATTNLFNRINATTGQPSDAALV